MWVDLARRSVPVVVVLLGTAFFLLEQAFAADLESYVGKYPFNDKVNNRTLYQIPELKNDFIKNFGSARWMTLLSYQTSTPIDGVNDPVLGRLIVAWQCRPHDCPNSAAVFLRPTATVLAICFAADNGTSDAFPADTDAVWSGVGWRNKLVKRPRSNCGMDAAEQAERLKAIMQVEKPK